MYNVYLLISWICTSKSKYILSMTSGVIVVVVENLSKYEISL